LKAVLDHLIYIRDPDPKDFLQDPGRLAFSDEAIPVGPWRAAFIRVANSHPYRRHRCQPAFLPPTRESAGATTGDPA